jgi:hypothetical protein
MLWYEIELQTAPGIWISMLAKDGGPMQFNYIGEARDCAAVLADEGSDARIVLVRTEVRREPVQEFLAIIKSKLPET